MRQCKTNTPFCSIIGKPIRLIPEIVRPHQEFENPRNPTAMRLLAFRQQLILVLSTWLQFQLEVILRKRSKWDRNWSRFQWHNLQLLYGGSLALFSPALMSFRPFLQFISKSPPTPDVANPLDTIWFAYSDPLGYRRTRTTADPLSGREGAAFETEDLKVLTKEPIKSTMVKEEKKKTCKC